MPRKPALDALTLFDALVYTCQYRLVIDPTSPILARVMEWKQALRERIGDYEGLFRTPGITLLETELPPDYERHLCDAIDLGSTGQPTFRALFNGFAHSEDRRTIHISVLGEESIAPLRQRIADHVRANKRIKKLGVQMPERSALVLATGLKAAQFEAAWGLLAPHPFTGEVRVHDVVLMKRELDPSSLDEHVRTFALRAGR